MKIAKKYKTLLCDDVRQEVGGKVSLMGIYGRDIVVANTPFQLPQLHLVIMLEEIINPFNYLFVKGILPGAKKPVLAKFAKPDDLNVGMNANITMGIAPFAIKETGQARFEVRFEEKAKPSIVHRFKIKIAGE